MERGESCRAISVDEKSRSSAEKEDDARAEERECKNGFTCVLGRADVRGALSRDEAPRKEAEEKVMLKKKHSPSYNDYFVVQALFAELDQRYFAGALTRAGWRVSVCNLDKPELDPDGPGILLGRTIFARG
jgi:hypothetical protein